MSVHPAVVRVASPHPALSPCVQAYVGIEQHAAETAAVSAMANPTLMVTWGGAVRPLTAGTREAIPLVVLAGPLSRSHRTHISAGACGFHVRLSPTGARALLRERPIADSWEDGLPPSVLSWAEAVAEAPTFEARAALTDGFLRSRLPGLGLWSEAAVDLIVRSGGTLPVGPLASALGVSEWTLRRRFDDDVGLAPKTFAQVERYRQAHGFLLRTPGATWRDACERFGYADQPHFVRTFHRFTGEAPTQWRPEDHGLDLAMGLRGEAP